MVPEAQTVFTWIPCSMDLSLYADLIRDLFASVSFQRCILLDSFPYSQRAGLNVSPSQVYYVAGGGDVVCGHGGDDAVHNHDDDAVHNHNDNAAHIHDDDAIHDHSNDTTTNSTPMQPLPSPNFIEGLGAELFTYVRSPSSLLSSSSLHRNGCASSAAVLTKDSRKIP